MVSFIVGCSLFVVRCSLVAVVVVRLVTLWDTLVLLVLVVVVDLVLFSFLRFPVVEGCFLRVAFACSFHHGNNNNELPGSFKLSHSRQHHSLGIWVWPKDISTTEGSRMSSIQRTSMRQACDLRENQARIFSVDD